MEEKKRRRGSQLSKREHSRDGIVLGKRGGSRAKSFIEKDTADTKTHNKITKGGGSKIESERLGRWSPDENKRWEKTETI